MHLLPQLKLEALPMLCSFGTVFVSSLSFSLFALLFGLSSLTKYLVHFQLFALAISLRHDLCFHHRKHISPASHCRYDHVSPFPDMKELACQNMAISVTGHLCFQTKRLDRDFCRSVYLEAVSQCPPDHNKLMTRIRDSFIFRHLSIVAHQLPHHQMPPGLQHR